VTVPVEYRHADHSRDFEPTDNYAQLREQCPLHHEADHDPPFYVLSRFDDIVGALRQHDEWRNRDGPGVFYQDNGVLGTTDEPDHGRHRRVLRPAFVPPSIERLAPRLRQITDELLDEFVDRRRGDFVDLLAVPLPALAIAELLGIDGEERHSFRRWSTDAVAALTGGDIDRYHDAKLALEDHVEAGVDRRAAQHAAGMPIADDVLGLLTIALRDGIIDRREMRHLGYQLLVAGHETTTSLLGTMLYRLLQRPELMARLRAEPALIPAAIEEALRFDSPVQGLFRTNAHEAVIHGTTIPAGSKMQLLFASANRDPGRFDSPDEFRIDRDRNEIGRHVAFGWGIHHCIGAPLARLETRVAFERVLARMDRIELAGVPRRNDSFVLHGLTHLPITWTPRETS
jgi:cytochrome P450